MAKKKQGTDNAVQKDTVGSLPVSPSPYGSNKTQNPLYDSLGRPRIMSLFWEYRSPDYPFYWTLEDVDIVKDGNTIPSLSRIYMSYDHIPGHEYDFAIDQFRLWKHWEKMCESSRFKPYVIAWRAELEIVNKAKYLKEIMKAAKEGDATASKYLVDGKYDDLPKRGRPSKAEKEGIIKQMKAEELEISSIGSRVHSLLERKKGTNG